MHLGNDGFVGGATVEVASSSGKRKRLRRPLQNLLPLEFREVGVRKKFQHDRRQILFKGRGGVPSSQEKLEDEKSFTFFKNKRTHFKGTLIEGGRFNTYLSFLNFKFQFPLPLPSLYDFFYLRVGRAI